MPKKEARKSRVDKDFPLEQKNKQILYQNTRSIYTKRVHSGAIEQYQNPDKRRGRKKQSAEEIAHKTAWAAVEKEYEKKGSKWVRKGE